MIFFRSLAVCLVIGTTVATRAAATDLPFSGESVVHFASEAEAGELLASADRFLNALSPFDRQSRVETDRAVGQVEFIAFVRSQVKSWSDPDRKNLELAIASLRLKLAMFELPFPPAVWLIKTSGREEGGAAYCRQHAIVIPESKTHDTAADLERLLTHELFHILSSHDAEFRRKCYRIIGFDVIQPVVLPDSLRELSITNPDGPLPDAVIHVERQGQPQSFVPILFSAEPRFNPQRGGPFFKYVTFRLMAVESEEGKWQASVKDGEPVLLTPAQIPDFGRKIGENTGYIIHPDEILADNFVHLIHGTPRLRSPQIVDALRSAWSRSTTK